MSEIKTWASERESDFVAELKQLAIKRGNGYSTDGTFTGYGLCNTASGALAESVYAWLATNGSDARVFSVIRQVAGLGFSHEYLRILSSEEGVGVDSTLGQINPKYAGVISVFPLEEEGSLFGDGRVYGEVEVRGYAEHTRRYDGPEVMDPLLKALK